MTSYIIRRFLYLLIVIFVVSIITFSLMHAVPGGPFDREKPLPEEVRLSFEKIYHLDEPLLVQFGGYLKSVFIPTYTTQKPTGNVEDDYLITVKLGNGWFRWGNFGITFTSRGRTVNDIFRQQLPVSFQLGIMAVIFALILGLILGIMAALNHNKFFDYLGMGIAIMGISVPLIVIGPIIVYVVGVVLKWLPPSGWGTKPPYLLGLFPSNFGWEYIKYTIMPAATLGFGSSALIARLTRASLLQVVNEDYVRTAKAKGLKKTTIIIRHALRNALIPVTTILGPMFAALTTGTFVVELIFGIPGMGKYFVNSIGKRDYPVIMGTVLLYAVFLVLSNLVVDIVYAFLDPRIRYD
jgi:ABC-type dipeptide/oligopeptide/nickel transport system permease component